MSGSKCSPFDPRCNIPPDNHIYCVFVGEGSGIQFYSYEIALNFIIDCHGGVGIIHKLQTEIVYFKKEDVDKKV